MEGENSSVLHHLEVCVKDETSILKLLISGFDFRLSYVRRYSNAFQWVLQSDKSFFVVTKHLIKNTNDIDCVVNGVKTCRNSSPVISTSDIEYPMMLCNCIREEHLQDSVFNVALEVKDLDSLYSSIKESNTKILQELTTINDKFGSIRLAIVESKCPNVVHSLIDKSKYFGKFLPGFKDASCFQDQNFDNQYLTLEKNRELRKPLTDFIDHVSLVCRIGESKSIIDWYQKCFKMKRFFSNKEDTAEDGFVLDGVIGMRLKALEYWRCAETGVSTSSDINCANTLKLVIVEPLVNVEKSQIANFLVENDGPGVQHIALNCKNIVHVVNEMSDRKVRFRMPPPTYYDQINNLNEILDNTLKNTYDEFRKSGVLIDVEEDLLDDNKAKYLLQIFTFPIFEKETFFLEVIERYGANGFGAGNIKALAISIARYQEELKNKEICVS
ncbi:UNVERIFIED_CONTAM: hypothetical protein RMT77_012803 [Armadillidium vulgare]